MLQVFRYYRYSVYRYFYKNSVISQNMNSGMEKVTVIYNEPEQSILFTLRYISEEANINRLFNLHRKCNENCSQLLLRMGENIRKAVAKKLKTKDLSAISIETNLLSKDDRQICDVSCLSCYDAIINGNNYILKIGNASYEFDVNPPVLKILELPKKNIMSGCLVYPTKMETINCEKDDVKLKWFRSNETYKNLDEAKCKMQNISWEEFGQGFNITLTSEEESRLIKVVGIPYQGDREGPSSECVSNVLITSSPEHYGFSNRHLHTSHVLNKDSLRVVSYNILADLYADSDFSRTNLFPTCPPYALAMDYRKQLIIKELLGYNADLICLQEVDEKIFRRDLNPIISLYGLDGVFKTKGSSTVSEGLATFYRKDKLVLKEECHFMLSQELETNPLFSDILEKVKLNEKTFEVVTKRPNILHVSVFQRKDFPSQILVVGSTHLYFDPLSDHIRILQAYICLTLLRQIMELQKSCGDKDVSLIFCGDFNSAPENAVYRYMTSQIIDEDDMDWSSKENEELKGISLSHDLEINSACGTPEYTNYTVGFKGCLDYIFYQSDKFSLEKVIPLPTHEELSENEALPSVKFPSDHVALIADLKWKK